MTVDSNVALDNCINDWKQATEQYNSDAATLQQECDTLGQMCDEGNAAGAFQYAMNRVMSLTMNTQGDGLNVLAASQNVSTQIGTELTDLQSISNSAPNITNQQAQQYVTTVQGLYSSLLGQANGDPSNQWCDQSTAQSYVSALGQLTQSLGAESPTQLTSTQVLQQNDWAADVNATFSLNGSDLTGSQLIANVNDCDSNLTSLSNSQNSALQAETQYATNNYTQIENSWQGMLTSLTQQYTAMVNNLKIA